MKDLLASTKKRVLWQMGGGLLLCGASAAAQGKPLLIIALAAGCVVGAFCWLLSGYRLLKSAALDVDRAKRSMARGCLLRILMIASVSVVAIRISVETLWAVLVGVFLAFGVALANAIAYALHDHAGKEP